MSFVFEGIPIQPTPHQPYWSVGQSQSSAFAHEPNASTSGIPTLEDAIEKLAEGGYVIDKRHFSWDQACAIISSPMDNCSLPPMTWDYWNEQKTFNSFEEFFYLLDSWKAEGKGFAMAYLSLDLYAEYWRRLGAKVGRKVNNEIVWKPIYSGPLFETSNSL